MIPQMTLMKLRQILLKQRPIQIVPIQRLPLAPELPELVLEVLALDVVLVVLVVLVLEVVLDVPEEVPEDVAETCR